MMSSQHSLHEEHLYMTNSQLNSGLVSDKKPDLKLGIAAADVRNKEGAFSIQGYTADNQQSLTKKLNQVMP